MQFIGRYFNRQVFWLEYGNYFDQLPNKDWVCLSICNNWPDENEFDKFVRTCISKNIMEFKGHGRFGELLHDLFDGTMAIMRIMESHNEFDVMTTWHNDQTLADAFWQSFFVTCIPETADYANITVICTDLDGVNRIEELKSYIKKFESGWLPSDL
jgi:hypothetical protein